MTCSKCLKNKPIVNQKYKCCNDCNYIRLNGRSREDVYADRASSKPVKIYTFKTKSKPRQQTDKEKEIKAKLHEVKSSLELEAIHDNRYYCWGCGKSYPGLDKSHILSVKHRKDMELVKENMNLFCRQCHMDWESGNVMKMAELLTFESDLQFILDNDFGVYGSIINKMQHVEKWGSENNPTVKKIKNILKIFYETVA